MYDFCMGYENMSPCTGSTVNISHDRIASCAGWQFRRRASEFQGNSATRYHAECPNLSAMTRPSKTDWHKPCGITHPSQQRADYGQERFSTVLRTPGTGVQISFLYEANMRTCLRALAAE